MKIVTKKFLVKAGEKYYVFSTKVFKNVPIREKVLVKRAPMNR